MSFIQTFLLLLLLQFSQVSIHAVYAQPNETEQRKEETQTAIATSINKASVDELKSQIENSTVLTDEEKKVAINSVQQALIELAAIADFENREKAAKAELPKVEDNKQRLQSQIEQLKQQKAKTYPVDEQDPARIGQELAVKKTELIEAQSILSETDKKLENRPNRQSGNKARLAEIPAELDALQKRINQLPAPDEANLVEIAERVSLLAKQKRLEVEPTTLQTELALSNARDAVSLPQMERERDSLQVEQLKKEVQSLTEALNIVRRRNATTLRDDILKEAQAAKASEEPWKKQLAQILSQTVEVIDKELKVQSDIQRLQVNISNTVELRESLSTSLSQLKNREGRIGASRSFGIRLRQKRSQLPDIAVLKSDINKRSQTYEDTQINYFEEREKRNTLEKLEANIDSLMDEYVSDIDPSDETTELYLDIKSQFENAIKQHIEALDRLVQIYDQHADELDNYDSEQTQLIQLSTEFEQYIDRRVLWIRSHEPLSISTVTSDVNNLKTLTNREIWSALFKLFKIDFWSHLFLYSLMIVIWGFLIFTQAQQSKRIQQTGKKATSRLNTSMKPTVQAVLMTVSKSAIVSLPLIFLGWRIQIANGNSSSSSPYFTHFTELSSNLIVVSIGLFFLEFIRNVHRSHGLAEAHFNWPKDACKLIEKQFKSFLYFATPIVILIAIISAWNDEGDAETLTRVFSIAVYILGAHAIHPLVHTRTGALAVLVKENKWIDRMGILIHLTLIAVPIILSVMTAIGYTYAANRLAIKFIQTGLLVFGLIFIRAVFLRWLTFRHRRLAIEEARAARATLSQIDSSHETTRKQAASEFQESKSILAEVSAQSRRLLNTSVVVLGIVGTWYFWTDVLPALHYFDEITIPGTSLQFPNLLVAIVLAILATTAARNIPGLMQITLLEWLPLEKSSRYAISALVQYAIAIFGIMVVSIRLGIGWDKVQWLAAALTFGLGFGLQEIFANFVSGLIILFEQPVRIGDVVTIDGVTGMVNRIRIRSTTIIDWDRKEYIVPNREFITGKLLNWTLTDNTNRIVMEVGVAYGTDPGQVRDIIMKIVRDNPHIMRDPAPNVTFDTFGDSALNFTLRAFLPNLDNRLETIHQLNVEIDKEFAAAGIEIPFPQRDLHVRSSIPLQVESELPVQPSLTLKDESER